MIVTDKYVFFYSAWPSNFTKAYFNWTAFGETHTFFCTEQAFMWAKAKFFQDEDVAKAILSEDSDPMTCKSLGRMVANYDDEKWSKVRYKYMLDVNIEKYKQNLTLFKSLMNKEYNDKIFVEASPSDNIWGIGLGMSTPVDILNNEKKWKGDNLLGKVITEVRTKLQPAKYKLAYYCPHTII